MTDVRPELIFVAGPQRGERAVLMSNLVVAGRSVIYAHRQPEYQEQFTGQWEKCVEQACKDFVADLARVVQIRDSKTQ